MAAAEYFNPTGAGQANGGSRPPAPPSQHMNSNPPYPMDDLPPPPPYSAFVEQRPHSQPPPQRPPPGDDIYRPAPQQSNGYLPEKGPRPPQTYRQDYGGGQYLQQPYQQQYGYFPPQGAGPSMPIYRDKYSTTPGYAPAVSPYRERSRSRSRSRSRRRKHHSRPQHLQKKKSSGVNTFLGAGGGAILGDAIFPGLGTIGGALLGGLGGHEYSKKRASSNPNKTRHRSYSNDFDYYDEEYRRGRRH